MSEGCQPQDCCGDPSAHIPTPEEIEVAKTALCCRCGVQVVESKAVTGTVLLNLYVPALGQRERLFTCGACGLALREFLHPELADDPVFQFVKRELLARFA